jgi:hypothetical protein
MLQARPGSTYAVTPETLAHQVAEMADGVLLWARLVVRSLVIGMAHHDTLKTLQERLENTHKNMNRLLRKVLGSIDPAVQ